MFIFLAASYAFYLSLLPGSYSLPEKQLPAPTKTLTITSPAPTSGIKKMSAKKVTPTLSPTPKIVISPQPTLPMTTPTQSPVSAEPNGFIPWSKIYTLRKGAGNCPVDPQGEVKLSLTSYDPKDNITGIEIKGNVSGLEPNKRYIVSIGSATDLGGPSITTDANGQANLDISNIAYSVNYDQIYSIAISDPNKIYPEAACLLADTKDGVG